MIARLSFLASQALACAALLWPTICTGQVTSNVFLRTRLIRAGNDVGTAFSLDVDGRQYLVTAKHVVKSLKQEDTIQLYKQDRWTSLSPVKVIRCVDPIDIAVLVPPVQETVDYELPTPEHSSHFFMGQDAYMIGYPYGLSSGGKGTTGPLPIPFIKRVAISAMTYEGEAHVIYLDGHNNPGFSGGPVVYRDLNRAGVEFRVAAVVSGFRHDYDAAYKLQALKPGEEKGVEPDRLVRSAGQWYRLVDTDVVIRSNTGIVIAYDIQHALDLIRKNPVGPKLGGAK